MAQPEKDRRLGVTDDVKEFVRPHREHGHLVGDATEPTVTGYRITIECPCGVTFMRHVTASEAAIDLAATSRSCSFAK